MSCSSCRIESSRLAAVLFCQLCVWAIALDSGFAQEVIATPRVAIDRFAREEFLDDGRDARLSMIAAGTLDHMHGPLLRRDLKITGAQSCSASNCHGGPQPGVSQPWARRGGAYQLWKENDPHSQSWRTMCSDESVNMMRRLKIIVGDRIVDQAGFDNCLACHNTTRRYDEPRSSVDRREGVGCAACHGPSERWRHTHFQSHWSPSSAQQEGFVNAGDLYVRARMCASCHIGDKDRDMNHDIIAAGHPTLRYELATFHAMQPKHWRDAESADKTFFEAQLWLAGQIAATDASLALLETRARSAHTVSAWPEFAAYNCASCHHNLGLQNARNPISPARKATAIYSQWNDAGIRWLLDFRRQTGQSTQEDDDLAAALIAVKETMETRPRPSADAVSDVSVHARKTLAAWFDGRPGREERLAFRSDRLGKVVASAAGNQGTFQSWESAVQFYLAAVAARESWPGGSNGPLRDVADRMRHGLRYPEMIDISRFAKRDQATGPTVTRFVVTRLGIELARGLGPVSGEAVAEQNEEEISESASHRKQAIDEINERWKKRRAEREASAIEKREVDPDKMEPAPRRKPKSAKELLEQRQGADGE